MAYYSAQDLVLFSAIIAAATRERDWDYGTGNNLKGTTVQEVQCMQIGENIYIACNNGEHARVASFLQAFGVSDHGSFILCLKYCHHLYTMPHADKVNLLGVGNDLKYSGPEQKAIDYSAPSHVHVRPLSEKQLTTAKTLISVDSDQPLEKRQLAYFLRKFVGTDPNPKFTCPPYGASLLIKSCSDAKAINVLEDSLTVHAELKLLRMVAEEKLAGRMMSVRRVNLGGLKQACVPCARWIELYNAWMKVQFKTSVELPPPPESREQGSGAGNRPLIGGITGYGNYVKNLFNGVKNESFEDISRHKDDEIL
ncbi:hypothetical protein [Pseudomonas sp. HS6]|uniref:hypothetical protein n=1 Tax=Pseudomonas sp. HS6 TaxID=2850559 RepID=UPI002019BA55|nr:hypothetical protein [Pseudomonas sp. HS6]UQS16835.1 hypothetical protein JJN09_08265 [Pseudomonas sp. HS6]